MLMAWQAPAWQLQALGIKLSGPRAQRREQLPKLQAPDEPIFWLILALRTTNGAILPNYHMTKAHVRGFGTFPHPVAPYGALLGCV